MEDNFQEDKCVFLKEGVNLKELISKGGVFEIDTSLRDPTDLKKLEPLLHDDVCFGDEFDSDTEDVMKQCESKIESLILSSPGSISFDDLAAKMQDAIPSGEVKILILEQGDGPLVPENAYITIHYAAYWEGETVPFDSTLATNEGKPMKIHLGVDSFLPGLHAGLTKLRGPTGLLQLLLGPRATWGPAGCLPRVRGQRCLFCIRLLETKEAIYGFQNLTEKDQRSFPINIQAANASKDAAKDLFLKKRYLKSLKAYHRALNILGLCQTTSDEESKILTETMEKIHINIAVCYLKLDKPQKIVMMCDELSRIVDIKKHAKCQYLYGKAFLQLCEFEKAHKHLKEALKLQPNNPEIGRELAVLDSKLTVYRKNETSMWKKVFEAPNSSKTESDYASVSQGFKILLRECCEKLLESRGKHKWKLPERMSEEEVECAMSIVKEFENLSFSEECNGSDEVMRSIVKNQVEIVYESKRE